MASWIGEVVDSSANLDTAESIENNLDVAVSMDGKDTLTGSAGADLFFIQLGDSITDLGSLKKVASLDELETSSGDVVMVV